MCISDCIHFVSPNQCLRDEKMLIFLIFLHLNMKEVPNIIKEIFQTFSNIKEKSVLAVELK